MKTKSEPNTHQPTMLTVRQVAERLGISTSLVYREIHEGRLHCHRFGKRAYRISEADVHEYVTRNHVEAGHLATGYQDDHLRHGNESRHRFEHIDVSRLLSQQT